MAHAATLLLAMQRGRRSDDTEAARAEEIIVIRYEMLFIRKEDAGGVWRGSED